VNDYGNNIFVDDMSIVEMDCNGTTAIQNISEKPKVILFPNPTQTIAQLTIPAEMGSRCAVEIFNADDRKWRAGDR
jgi:hypothetical protein